MYYIRFTNNAQADLERGYSFASYLLFNTYEEAVEEIVENLGDDEELLVQDNVTGMWGRRLSGLCGFGPFDTAEEAQAAIAEYAGRYGGEATIFEGEDSWDSSIDMADDEGCRFTPIAIVS